MGAEISDRRITHRFVPPGASDEALTIGLNHGNGCFCLAVCVGIDCRGAEPHPDLIDDDVVEDVHTPLGFQASRHMCGEAGTYLAAIRQRLPDYRVDDFLCAMQFSSGTPRFSEMAQGELESGDSQTRLPEGSLRRSRVCIFWPEQIPHWARGERCGLVTIVIIVFDV